MKKRILFSMMVIALITGGCLTDDNDDDGGVSAETWLALTSGAERTFERSDVSDGATETVAFATVSAGTATVNGNTCHTVIDTYPDHADTLLVRTSGEAAYAFPGQLRASMRRESPGTASGADAAFLKFGKKPGDTWTISDSGQLLGGSTVLAGKYVGTEDVTVPAGSYAGCEVFDLTLTQSMLVSGGATVVTTTTARLWYAKNIGLVKRTEAVIRNDGKTYTTTRTTVIALKTRIIAL